MFAQPSPPPKNEKNEFALPMVRPAQFTKPWLMNAVFWLSGSKPLP